jgi:hypothetical protein
MIWLSPFSNKSPISTILAKADRDGFEAALKSPLDDVDFSRPEAR